MILMEVMTMSTKPLHFQVKSAESGGIFKSVSWGGFFGDDDDVADVDIDENDGDDDDLDGSDDNEHEFSW